MKKLLLSSIASVAISSSVIAADLPSIKSAPTPVPVPMWTGFYAGLNAGGIWTNDSFINASTSSPLSIISPALFSGPFPTSSSAGFIGGGQIGYNWQFAVGGIGLIVGAETDAQGVAGSGGIQTTFRYGSYQRYGSAQTMLSSTQASASIDYIGTVKGKLGYLISPNLMVYGTGGLSYGGININLKNFQSYTDLPNTIMLGNNAISKTQVGWTGGGGIEWMFAPSWSAKAEYLYYDLGSTNAAMYNTNYYSNYPPITNSVTQFSTRFNGNIVRVGVNYHFNFVNNNPVATKF